MLLKTATGDIKGIVCEKCKKKVLKENSDEWDEIFSITFIGGKSSVFGFMEEVSCDLCQYCFHKLIKNYCYYEDF